MIKENSAYDIEMASLASQLPQGSELPESAWQAVVQLNKAVLRGDLYEIKRFQKIYQACIWKLNGNTLFGAAADSRQAAEVIDAYCQAENGHPPLWGQLGKCLIVSGTGVRSWVEIKQGLHYCSAAYNVIDLDKPFISETGYRHHIFHFNDVRQEESVTDYLTRVLDEFLNARKKPLFLNHEYRNSHASKKLPYWLAGIRPIPCRLPETLPEGFVRVEALLPASKAFTARKWSEAAQERIQALLQEQNIDGVGSEHTKKPSEQPKPYKGGLTTVQQYNEFYVGAICEIVSVHHPVFNRLIGNRIKIVTIYDSGTIMAHDDKPVITRLNRRGNTVTVSDPSTIRSFYSVEQLKLVSP